MKLRFGLRTLLIAVTLAAVGLGCITFRIREGQRHRAVYTRLFESGNLANLSHFELVYNPTGTPTNAKLQSTLPAWLEATGLAAAFRRIDRVSIACPRPYDETFRLLADLGEVNSVSVVASQFDESDLEKLLGAVQVEHLYIRQAQLPRGRVPCLSRQRLTWLCVAHTQFSDPAIDDLPGTLAYFDATRTRITDQGLSGFTRLKRLKTLNLSRTPTTKAAIDQLSVQMPECEIHWEPLK